MLASSFLLAFAALPALHTLALQTTAGVRQSAAGKAQLDALFWEVANPSSPLYQNYIQHAELPRFLKSDEADVSRARAWLGRQGCTGCVLRAHTRDALACDCPRITAHPADVPIDYVYQASQQQNPRAPGHVHAGAHARSLQERASAFPPNYGTPKRQRASYGIPETLVGTNKANLQEVWGCGTFGVNKTELSMYYDRYCPTCSVDDITYGTAHHGVEGGDNFLEGTLDTTYISSFAPGVRTINSNTNISMATEEGEAQGVATVFAMEAIAARATDLPLVLSLSLGSLGYASCDAICTQYAEDTGRPYSECHAYIQEQRQVCLYASYAQQERINTAFKVMGLRGTTVLGASGDGGSHWSFGAFNEHGPNATIAKALNSIGCRRQSPLFPANSPYIVAVGGLTWHNNNSEDVLAWSCVPGSEGGSGGGFSDVWPAPPYQANLVDNYFQATSRVPGFAQGYNRTGRAYPDLSAFMDGVPLCFNGVCHPSIVGGTSASTPTIAGIFSLVNDHRLNKGLKPLGFVVPKLWALAEAFPGEVFKDITSGNTSCGCGNGFVAAKGWDPLTGHGQPIWAGFVKHLGSD